MKDSRQVVNGNAVRTSLWTVLSLSVAGNIVAQLADLGVAVRVACGVVTMLCVIWLIAVHLRTR